MTDTGADGVAQVGQRYEDALTGVVRKTLEDLLAEIESIQSIAERVRLAYGPQLVPAFVVKALREQEVAVAQARKAITELEDALAVAPPNGERALGREPR